MNTLSHSFPLILAALLMGSSCGGRTSNTDDRKDDVLGSGGSLGESGGQGGNPVQGSGGIGTGGTAPTWQLTCGDGQLEPGEGCDDGKRDDGDGCDSNCCVVFAGTQSGTNGWCPGDGRPCHCGDGSLELGEESDDGNLVFGDGCNRFCELETGLGGNQR